MAEDGRTDKKFAHLLQPIRSLSDNWDIDIATELEEYLEELEELVFSFEGGPSLNFAEAALVIQGSACVYSRKVEYLHGLVYQALDAIAESKKRQARSRGQGAKAGEDTGHDDEADFLFLDAVIEEGKGIDLDEDRSKAPESALRPPPSLLALEDAGAQCEGRGDGEDGNFKISFCYVDGTGALLLEQDDNGAAYEELHSLSAAARDRDAEDCPGPSEEDLGPSGFEYGDDDFGEPLDLGPVQEEPVQEDRIGVDTAVAGAAENEPLGTEPVPTDGADLGHGAPASNIDAIPFFDPYKPLDMYSTQGYKTKRYRRMRINQRQALARDDAEDPDAPAFAIPNAVVNGCTYPEFEYILQARRAQESMHSARLRAACPGMAGPSSCFTSSDAQRNGAAEEEEEEGEDIGNDLPCDDCDDGGLDDGFGDLDEWAEAQDNTLPHHVQHPEAVAPELLSYEELCKAHLDAFIASAAAAEVQTDLASRVSSWQSKIEPALEVQSQQGAFDIHEYGERILGNLDNAGSTSCQRVGFEAAVVGSARYEVSRTFSAMLQLVNNGNLKIHHSGNNTVCPFELEIVSRELTHKQMGVSGAFSFQCSAAAVNGTAGPVRNDEIENIDGSVGDDGRSPLQKLPRTSSSRRQRQRRSAQK